ncbi:MAG: DUF721 domain-containing protein [Candidatus Omnitrophota bacterium]
MRRHTKRPEDIKEIINKVLRRLEKKGSNKTEKILGAWQKIAGGPALNHSRPVSVKRGIITVEVDSSTWLYTLSLKKKEILSGLQKELKEERIKDIRLRIGDIT